MGSGDEIKPKNIAAAGSLLPEDAIELSYCEISSLTLASFCWREAILGEMPSWAAEADALFVLTEDLL